MVVKDFIKDVGPIFTLHPFVAEIIKTQEECDILNFLFTDKFATCVIDYDPAEQTLEDVQLYALLTMVKNIEYYKAIQQSIATKYNPLLEAIDVTTTHNKTLTETRTKTGMDTTTHTGTETTQINGTVNGNAETTNTDNNTMINTNNTFDNAAYRESDRTTQDATGSTTTEQTTTTDNTSTLTHDTDQIVDYNTTENNEHIETSTDKTTGHNQMEYAKVLKEMYEAKKINLYDVIVVDVGDVICEMLYYF